MAGHTHKSSAQALKGRQLVKISKRDGWSAVVTDVGRYYLDHGSLPPRSHQAYRPRPQLRAHPSKPGAQQREAVADRTDASPSAVRLDKPRKLSPTEQLVADVVAAGGVLKVPRDPTEDWRRAEGLVRSANRYGKTPPGRRLVHKLVYESDHWYGPRSDLFKLVDGPVGTDALLLPVPVPNHVERYHPAVSALRKAKRLCMGSTALPRALYILQAVAAEAECRGFTVAACPPQAPVGRTDQPIWHLLLVNHGETVPLRIEEETDRVEHVPSPQELKDHERRPWIRIPTHDHVPSGRLRIELGGQSQLARKASWADRASWRLEDKLPELLREAAIRADELRLRREAKAQAAEEHRQAVEREEDRGRARAAEAHRQEILQQQLSSWRAAEELREYAAAVAVRLATAETGGQADANAIEEAHRWLEWIEARADHQDPTLQLAAWPKPPQLPSYELRKFMKDVPQPEEMRYQPESY